MTGTLDGPGSVRKALRVLEQLAENNRVTDLAKATGLPKSTVHRTLQVLVEAGFATVHDNNEYRPGNRILQLAGKVLYRFDPAIQAGPHLEKLRDETDCTIHFAMRFGSELLYVHKVEPDKPYQMSSRIGMYLPWHTSAIGKAALAALPAEERETLIGTLVLHPRTPHSVTIKRDLRTQLAEARRLGYALDDGENELGVRCVGAAVHDHIGTVIGGISISSLSLEHSMEQLQQFGPRVSDAALDVSAALGHTA